MRFRRAVVLVSAMALATSFLQVPSGVVPRSAAAEESPPVAVTEAQASVLARKTGKPVPVAGLQTETRDVVANSDGTFSGSGILVSPENQDDSVFKIPEAKESYSAYCSPQHFTNTTRLVSESMVGQPCEIELNRGQKSARCVCVSDQRLGREIALVADKLLVDERDAGFWIVIAGCAGMAMFACAMHVFVVKGWRTHTILDSYFNKRRQKLTEAYLGGDGSLHEEAAMFIPLPVATIFGMWALGSLLLKIGEDKIEWMGFVAVVLWLLSFIPALVAWRRTHVGPPERVKPQWLIEEERRREDAGEIMRTGRWWVRTGSKARLSNRNSLDS